MKKCITLLLFMLSMACIAQEGIVKGVLADSNGPLPGANVQIKGSTTGTQTDFDGNYSIKAKVGDTIIISYVGYTNQQIKVTADMLTDIYDSSDVTIRQLAVALDV